MSSRIRRRCTVLLAGLLVIVAAGAASAQAEIEGAAPTPDASRSPGLADVALCQMPELGEPAGRIGPTIASSEAVPRGRAGRWVPIVEADPFDPAYGCTFPVVDLNDPFTGESVQSFFFDDPRLPGIIGQVSIFETELGRRDLRDVMRQRGVSTVGRLRPGRFTVVIVGHDEIPSDVGVNVFTNFDGRPSNDVPLGARNPDLPVAGVDAGYSVFGDRLFVTDFRDGPEYYTGSTRANPFAAVSGQRETAFLLPVEGHGATITPFVFANDAFHYLDILPNGTLPVQGSVPLFPTCLAQEVVHLPLTSDGEPLSASTDWVTSCFPIGTSTVDRIEAELTGPDPLHVGLSLSSFDQGATDRRQQKTYAEVSAADGNLYVRFPSGLLRYGYHNVFGPIFDPTGDPILDVLLGAAAWSLDTFLIPVAVNETEGLIQGLEPCLPPGEQAREPIG